MDEKKEHEKVAEEKMQRARGLMSTKNGDELGKHGSDRWRHGKAGDDDQRKEEKDHGEVREALQDVVRVCLDGTLEAQMVVHGGAEGTPEEAEKALAHARRSGTRGDRYARSLFEHRTQSTQRDLEWIEALIAAEAGDDVADDRTANPQGKGATAS